jgi:hypothetical protein
MKIKRSGKKQVMGIAYDDGTERSEYGARNRRTVHHRGMRGKDENERLLYAADVRTRTRCAAPQPRDEGEATISRVARPAFGFRAQDGGIRINVGGALCR